MLLPTAMSGSPLAACVRRLLVAALVLGAEFAAFESFLRWQGGSEAAPVFQQLFMPDPAIGYRLRPGQSVVYTTREFTTPIAINAQGVRDDAIGPKAAASGASSSSATRWCSRSRSRTRPRSRSG